MKRGRDRFNNFKPIIKILINICSILPRKIRVKLLESTRMTTGTKGLVIRYILLSTLVKSIGDNVSIHPNVYLFNVDNLSIGDNVSIHPMCYIEAKGGIELGSNISIAHSATLLSVNHIYSDVNIPIKDQGIQYNRLEVKSDVWIGAKSTILAGVTIEKGVVIAAGAVVTKSVNSHAVVAGVPAKLIKNRI